MKRVGHIIVPFISTSHKQSSKRITHANTQKLIRKLVLGNFAIF